MLTAILADDEPMILRGLEKLIDWQAMGVTIVGTAGDGLEALALIEEKQPDLLVSDINMPDFTGIDVLKKLNEDKVGTEVIFISGYQEFSYAQDAIKYGAVDYLIKPINEKQLVMAIQKVVEEKNRHLAQPITLELHLDTGSDSDGFEEVIADTKMHLMSEEGHYAVLCCQLDDRGFDVDELEIISFSMKNIIEGLVEDIQGHWVITKGDRVHILLYSEHMEEVEALISTLPGRVIGAIDEENGQSVSVSASDVVSDISEIRRAFMMAGDRMKQAYFYGQSCVLNHPMKHQNKFTLEDLYRAQVAVLDSISTYDSKKIEKAVVYYMDIVRDVSLWDKKTAINYCLATLVFIHQHLSDGAVNLKKKDFDYVSDIFTATFYYEQMIAEMIGFCSAYLEEIKTYATVQQNEDINRVKTYISEHYAEPIRLETLADLVFMNPNYFSGYFKKHVGMKFKEYITNYRINEAEKLMLSTNYKVYEIAEAVGFGDYRHFSEVFKKVKGQSPSEYRKKIMKTG